MTKSYTFSINYALDYTCHRLTGSSKSINFCGKCNSCQIVTQLNNLKQWFDRASHLTHKTFLIGLITRINNIRICKYLNDILKPITDSKDYIYARNKFLPSCDEDHLKATNNRCLDTEYVENQIKECWQWYSSSSNYIKLNFMLSLLNKCEQAIVFFIILKLKSILETHSPYSDSAQSNREFEEESEMVFDAYDDEEEEEEDELEQVDQEVNNILKKDNYLLSKDSKHVDFIRLLPVHISKSILNSLDKKTLFNCLFVCKYWNNLIKEVHRESFLHKILLDDMMLLKGISSKGINPRYANNVDVKVPNLLPGSYELVLKQDEQVMKTSLRTECNWTNAFQGYSTRNVIIEERNVFCGPYNVLLLKEKRDPHRVIHFNGNNTVAFGSFDKKLRFIDLKSAQEKNTTISGHAGSIKCVYVNENKKIVITGSYDTSIRVWSIDSGKCLRIFQGHQNTVTCLSMFDELDKVISGSMDKTCKVWNLGKKKCWRTFKHSYQIISVAIAEEICITGGQTGKIKVFNLQTGKCIKTISAHQGPVNAIKFDRWHILTCSSDGYALAFSTQGKHKNCIVSMRHPKEVLCLEFQYLRAITGSADGKLRIWNILSGDCLRVMRGNSQCDPILSMSIVENRILMNTEFNVILMEFEILQYDYTSTLYNLEEQSESNLNTDSKRSSALNKKNKNYSLIRASRSELVATPNVKLFNDDRKSVLDHSARPISAKNLKDAQLVHQITSKQPNISRNSIGNISELGLLKRESIVKNINTTILTQTSLSAISNRTTVLSHQITSNNVLFKENKIEQERAQLERDLEEFKIKNHDLNETKQFLREQLKEMKQLEQSTPSSQNLSPDLNSVETKSCIESRLLNRTELIKSRDDSDLILSQNRPTSSPSRMDTRTRIRLREQELNKIRNSNSNGDFKKTRKEFNINRDEFNRKEKPIVTKIFESQEIALKTNKKMHPVNIKSKIPNPKIINTILVNKENDLIRMNRCKSANIANLNNKAEMAPILFRPKTNLPKRKPREADYLIDPSENSKLATNNHLNLKTFKEVDQMVFNLNGGFSQTDKTNFDQEEEFYKKLWVLKSTGKYHGSLLAKPKTVAPEIRE